MSDKTFYTFYDINSYRSLLDKCSYELSHLPLVTKAQPRDSYTLFNLVLTLNHLFDWAVKDERIDERVRMNCVREFNPYNVGQISDAENNFPIYRHHSLMPFPPTNPQQWLIRQVANRVKHLKASPKLGRSESMILRQGKQLEITWFIVDDIEGHPTELIGQCQLLQKLWTQIIGDL